MGAPKVTPSQFIDFVIAPARATAMEA